MVEQIGKIAGEKLDGVRACRFVRFTVAAAIVDQDRDAACEPLDHRLPEPPIHGEGMDKHDAVRTLAVEGIGEARPVAGCRHGGRHRSRACFQVWRTLWHANEQTPAVRPKGRKSKA
jgi:hypothetical protein